MFFGVTEYPTTDLLENTSPGYSKESCLVVMVDPVVNVSTPWNVMIVPPYAVSICSNFFKLETKILVGVFIGILDPFA
jgi:hypothetical protein